ncbi:lipoprotein signal peptidase [Bombiscardovia apis]|uniref:Lipoprotein signal peptidase n=1 Tax=Bombiscardovia apis TaxID=2932182 RepID=A0ABM8BBU1_9BIFI|nr:lipoprotein signal peptidase [Bombiscardovia apis]
MAVFACLVLLALGLDQVTKALAQVRLSETNSKVFIPGLLSLRLLRNPGASLGLGSGYTWVISLIAIFASLAFIVLLLRTDSIAWTVALAFAFAGAVGNLIDRIAYAQGFLNGRVVDFLDYGWSVGNIADVYLSFAALAIVALILFGKPFNSLQQAQTERDAGEGAADSQEVNR